MSDHVATGVKTAVRIDLALLVVKLVFTGVGSALGPTIFHHFVDHHIDDCVLQPDSTSSLSDPVVDFFADELGELTNVGWELVSSRKVGFGETLPNKLFEF